MEWSMSDVDTAAPGDNRPPVYWEDDYLIIRASALGHSCMWELIAAGQGYEPGLLPRNLIRAFNEGHMLEPLVIDRMKMDGWVVFGSQDQGHLVISPKLMVRYHPDGEGNKKGGDIHIIEIKCLSDALWLQAKQHGVGSLLGYGWQASIMMHATSMPLVWVVYNKGLPPDQDGVKPPCERQGEIFYEYVAESPIDSLTIIQRAEEVYEGVMGEDLLVDDRPCDDPSHWPCRYLNLRPEPETQEASVLVDDEHKEDVDRLVREYLFNKGQADECTARAQDARDQLIALAGDAERLVTDHWVIPVVNSTSTWHSFKGASDEDREVIDKYRQSKPTKYIGKPKPLA
jgi:hypothetical protein